MYSSDFAKMKSWFNNHLCKEMGWNDSNIAPKDLALEVEEDNESWSEEFNEEENFVFTKKDFEEAASCFVEDLDYEKNRKLKAEEKSRKDFEFALIKVHGQGEAIRASFADPKGSDVDRRNLECEHFYGKKAFQILAMETNMQSKYDQIIDSHNPKYWPVVPINFKDIN